MKIDATIFQAGMFQVHFDGGTGGPDPSPNCYGSWELCLNGRQFKRHLKEWFGEGTNNMAEYMALELGLLELSRMVSYEAKKASTLTAYTDSLILANHFKNGGPKSKDAWHLVPF